MHLLAPAPVAAVIFAATLMGLIENIVIFFVVSRKRDITLRMALLTLSIIGVGVAALVLLAFFGQ